MIKRLEKEYLEEFDLDELSIPLSDCSRCRLSSTYSTIAKALDHLKKYHMTSSTFSQTFEAQAAHWIVSPLDAEAENKIRQIGQTIHNLNTDLARLRSKSIDIRNSVADQNNEKPSDYLLPQAMVKAFENTLQTVYTARYCIAAIQEHVGTMSRTDSRNYLALIKRFADQADTSLSKARNELLLMAHASDTQNLVLHIRCTPETSILFVLCFLSLRPLLGGSPAHKLYREHLSSMVCTPHFLPLGQPRKSEKKIGRVGFWRIQTLE
jgi:hypothetical protein